MYKAAGNILHDSVEYNRGDELPVVSAEDKTGDDPKQGFTEDELAPLVASGLALETTEELGPAPVVDSSVQHGNGHEGTEGASLIPHPVETEQERAIREQRNREDAENAQRRIEEEAVNGTVVGAPAAQPTGDEFDANGNPVVPAPQIFRREDGQLVNAAGEPVDEHGNLLQAQ